MPEVAGVYDDEARRAKSEFQYNSLVQKKSKDLIGHMCFVADWYPVPMPIENRFGSCMWDRVESLSRNEAVVEYPPRIRESPEEAPGMNILVFPDSYGFATGVLDSIPKNMIESKRMLQKSIASVTEQDISRLMTEKWDLILFFAGVDSAPDNSAAEIIKHQDGYTKPFLFLIKEIVKNPENCKQLGVLIVDTMAEDRAIHEECGLGITAGAVLYGMANTARFELECPVHVVETEWSIPDESMKMLASEFIRKETFGIDTVRILKSGRYVQRLNPSTKYEQAINKAFIVPDHGVIGISGGNGSLGLVMGGWLMDVAATQGKGGFTVKFLSRSMKIRDDDIPMWEEIQSKAEKLGIIVEQARCDIGKPSDVDQWISEVTPNLTGFIHSAGIIRDAMLFNQSWDMYEEVFNPKHRAALHLHEALDKYENPNLRFLWLFSSMASYGHMGQSSYAGSNACLDAIARHRRALGLPCMTVNWGAWGEVGMAKYLDAGAKHRIDSGPCPYFRTREGLDGLECGLRSGLPFVGCYKYNVHAAWMSVQDIKGPVHQWNRNLLSNMFVPPPTSERDAAYLDDVLRTLTGGTTALPMEAGLVWRKWVLCANDGEDDGDDW